MAFVWIFNGFCLIFCLLLGWMLIKKHSVFPNTEVGYHFRQAMTDERAWKAANRCAGWISLLCGALFFLLLPVVLFLCGCGFYALVWTSVGALCLYVLLALLLPLAWLRHIKNEPDAMDKIN